MFSTNSAATRVVALAAAVFAYFVVYPEDAQAITAPVVTLLTLSNAVSPWLYGVAATGIIAWAIVARGSTGPRSAKH